MPSIVQFFHPGSEHGYDKHYKNSKYLKNWNKEDHKRKFIINKGSYIENNIKYDGIMSFWCEWEPTSLVENLYAPNKILPHDVYPKYLHFPFLPPKDRIKIYQEKNYQNTDPFVFGDKFRYAICRQDSCPVLKDLEKGSLILFGSRVNNRFAIDTVFVVKEYLKYYSTLDKNLDYLGLYTEIVLRMACEEKLATDKINRTLYTGATYDDPINGMYSFVPARKYENKKQGFPRIIMPDDFYDIKNNRINKYFSKWEIRYNKIYEGKNTGINETYASLDEITFFWNYIKEFTSKNHVLGYNFEMPKEEEIIKLK